MVGAHSQGASAAKRRAGMTPFRSAAADAHTRFALDEDQTTALTLECAKEGTQPRAWSPEEMMFTTPTVALDTDCRTFQDGCGAPDPHSAYEIPDLALTAFLAWRGLARRPDVPDLVDND